MANRPSGEALRRLNTILRVGAMGGLADGSLLEQFTTRPGEVASADTVPESLDRLTTEDACRFAAGHPIATGPAVALAAGLLKGRRSLTMLGAVALGAAC